MEYVPKVGDVCEMFEHEVVLVEPLESSDGWVVRYYGIDLKTTIATQYLHPLRPTRAGQRVRREKGNGHGLTESAVDGFARVRWDVDSTGVVRLSSLVVIADEPKAAEWTCDLCRNPTPHDHHSEAAPSSPAPLAWTPPKCGRAGHDPECLCATGWVREAEPEPSVRCEEKRHTHRDDQDESPYRRSIIERVWFAEGSGRVGIASTRDGAIAAWREASRGK